MTGTAARAGTPAPAGPGAAAVPVPISIPVNAAVPAPIAAPGTKSATNRRHDSAGDAYRGGRACKAGTGPDGMKVQPAPSCTGPVCRLSPIRTMPGPVKTLTDPGLSAENFICGHRQAVSYPKPVRTVRRDSYSDSLQVIRFSILRKETRGRIAMYPARGGGVLWILNRHRNGYRSY